MTTLTNSQPRDFQVSLMSHEVDEHGAPWERCLVVIWDAGVEPRWEDWLDSFCKQEGEKYSIEQIQEVTDYNIEKF